MPIAKLNRRTLDASQPQAAEYELRDSVLPGFLCRIAPNGRKTFMLQYRTTDGRRRKPAIGAYGELTAEQARAIAQKWMADVRAGGDPLFDKQHRRETLTLKQLFTEFMDRHVAKRCRRTTYTTYDTVIRRHILPVLGHVKIDAISKEAMKEVIADFNNSRGIGKVIITSLKKMFNQVEYWGYLERGKNPCKGFKPFPVQESTRLLLDDELARIFRYLDLAHELCLENEGVLLAARLQFAFSARISEILTLEWSWIDFSTRRVVWPDTKTGRLWKPLSVEAHKLLKKAELSATSIYVIPAPGDQKRRMPYATYWAAWGRILKQAKVTHVGTHAVRHRAATDIANSGLPLKVGMALTGHKDIHVFMRYVHIVDNQVHDAINLVEKNRCVAVNNHRKYHP